VDDPTAGKRGLFPRLTSLDFPAKDAGAKVRNLAARYSDSAFLVCSSDQPKSEICVICTTKVQILGFSAKFLTTNGRELTRMIASYSRSFVSIRGWFFMFGFGSAVLCNLRIIKSARICPGGD
jgi:hypothetical protein